jgi:hypothetical protein
MNLQRSLIYRIGVGKGLGLLVGLAGFLMLPYFVSEPSMFLRVGVLLWYPTMGAFIGMFGIFSKHPVVKFPMPWWFRGALVGGWMNFLLTLIAYEQICAIVMAVFGEYSAFASPFWMVAEGIIIGMAMDFILTKYFGDGGLD